MSVDRPRPMTDEDLQRIEAALGKPLPQTFRDVMKNFPQKLIDAAVMTDDLGEEFIDSMMISPDTERIVSSIEAPAWPGWPKNLIRVGDNGCGEEYSVDISDEKCPVYESGPHNDAGASGPEEAGYFEKLSDDLASWVKYLASRIP